MKCRGKRDTTCNISLRFTISQLHFMLNRGKSITFGTVWMVIERMEYCWILVPLSLVPNVIVSAILCLTINLATTRYTVALEELWST